MATCGKKTLQWIAFIVLCAGLSGCDQPEEQKRSATAGNESAVGMALACSRCHVLPPADALPRHVWPSVIDQMKLLAAESDQPLHSDDVAEARDYYQRQSPGKLERADENFTEGGDQWNVSHFTPPGLENVLKPAVSHVTIASMEDGAVPSVLAAELRSSSLLLLPLRQGGSEPEFLYPALRDLEYPGHIATRDMNDDGLLDLVIAGMGTLQPDNSSKGMIVVAQQVADRGFKRQVIVRGLGRPAATDVGDFDQDGDLDFVFAAFGMRDAGQLAIIENRSISTRGEMKTLLNQLDSRDGFCSVRVADLDGDGDQDIAALVAQEHEQVMVFRNEGGMRFSPHIIWSAPHPSWAFTNLQLVDLNADGLLDIVTANGDSLDYNEVKSYSGIQWFENSGDLKFYERGIGALPGASCSAAADMDGDGDLDLVATAFMPLSTPAEWISRGLASIVWYENPGADNLSRKWGVHVVEKFSASHPTVAVADCDGDGRSDIVVGNYVWIDKSRGALHRSPYVSIYTRKSR